MKKMKSILMLTATLFLAFTMNAQMPSAGSGQTTDVSNEELQQFAAIIPQMQEVQMKYNQKMKTTVEESGLGIQKFNEMAQAEMSPEKEMSGTAEEKSKFNDAFAEVKAMQAQQEQEMNGIIEGSGLTQDRFQEISMAIRQNPELQQKIRGMMNPEGGQGQGQGGQ